ncbi:MAG: L,D-transpeptidase family protein [Lentisphaeria bacterium]|nr:L,D-transpeptidase family protein [Lentisphaeria bacterium]
MYWYYKYPLFLLFALVVLGTGALVWKALPEKVVDKVKTPFESDVEHDSDGAADGKVNGAEDGGAKVPPIPSPSGDTTVSTGGSKPPSAAPTVDVQMLLAGARRQLGADNLIAARALASKAMKGVALEFDRQWYECAELITQVNTRLMNSSVPAPEKISYTIREGDALVRIAYRNRTTVGALQRLNDSLAKDDSRIYPGRILFYIKADWKIRVVKSRFLLILQNGDEFYKLYHIAIGRENRTPEGTFEIISKVLHPEWTHPTGRVIPYGDPENVLGTHWMALKPVGATPKHLIGYGIHGTKDPDSIGTRASLGCVRMLNDKIAELYEYIPTPAARQPGVTVTIEE